MSQSKILKTVSNCQGAILPFHPGFVYAAFESTDELTILVLPSKPDFIGKTMEALDVSSRKVRYLINSKKNISNLYRSASVIFPLNLLMSWNKLM
jgi:hypothetical protein